MVLQINVVAPFQGDIALWKGGVIRRGVGGDVNISIEFRVADIWYQRRVIVTIMREEEKDRSNQ